MVLTFLLHDINSSRYRLWAPDELIQHDLPSIAIPHVLDYFTVSLLNSRGMQFACCLGSARELVVVSQNDRNSHW